MSIFKEIGRLITSASNYIDARIAESEARKVAANERDEIVGQAASLHRPESVGPSHSSLTISNHVADEVEVDPADAIQDAQDAASACGYYLGVWDE